MPRTKQKHPEYRQPPVERERAESNGLNHGKVHYAKNGLVEHIMDQARILHEEQDKKRREKKRRATRNGGSKQTAKKGKQAIKEHHHTMCPGTERMIGWVYGTYTGDIEHFEMFQSWKVQWRVEERCLFMFAAEDESMMVTVGAPIAEEDGFKESLFGAVKSGHVTLGPIRKRLEEEGDPGRHIETGVGCMNGIMVGVRLTGKAFAELKTHPEDSSAGIGGKRLLNIIKYLRPQEVAKWFSDENELDSSHSKAVITRKVQLHHASRGDDSHDKEVELDASSLYELIKPDGTEQTYDKELRGLLPTLHGYQKRALHWMVQRETKPKSFHGVEARQGGHMLWRPVHYMQWSKENDGVGETDVLVECKDVFYMNVYTGSIQLTSVETPPPPRGGIACDEMGLGKTVETLALIIANPSPVPHDMKCHEHVNRRKNVEKAVFGWFECICGESGDAKSFGYSTADDHPWIQCIRCNTWSHQRCNGKSQLSLERFMCTGCVATSITDCQPIYAKTTLIVCPASILSQWESEIERHVTPGSLKVMKYLGQPQPVGSKVFVATTPYDIARADIVLTTYDVLRQDLYRNPDKMQMRSLRYNKRYDIIPTPLTSIRFWRIVVDEAQMVESSTAKATEMALKIDAVNRWCVTGTPISRGLEDLYGLMCFLKVEPYAHKFWWNRLIQMPLEEADGNSLALVRLLNLLKPKHGGIMWRSMKKYVQNELQIPRQEIQITKLEFSKIEKHFYDRQHHACEGAARQTLPNSILSLSSDLTEPKFDGNMQNTKRNSFRDRPLTKREERKVLLPLLRLRQACVHPQIGAGGIRSLSQVKTPMSMVEILHVLIGKAKVEAEDSQRILLSNLNGLAGLKILQSMNAEAVTYYRKVLSIAKENKSFINADKLQMLHAMHNLLYLLESEGRNIGRTIQDSYLKSSITKMREEYLQDAFNRLAGAKYEMQNLHQSSLKIVTKFSQEKSRAKELVESWWIQAIHLLMKNTNDWGQQISEDLRRNLMEDDMYRQSASKNASNLASRFRDLNGLKAILKQELEEAEAIRNEVNALLASLGNRVEAREPSLISTAAHCSACRSFHARSAGGLICDHCHLDKKFISWEVRLFNLKASARGNALLTAEVVAEAAHRQSLARVGRGGVGERVNVIETHREGSKRSDAKVADAKIVRAPSMTERALRFIASALRSIPLSVEAEKEQQKLLLEASKVHLELLENRRREFIKAGALSIAQRQALYAMDELEMCIMRIRLKEPNEPISPDQEGYVVSKFEVPSRLESMEADSVASEAELQKSLGTLKYLKSLEDIKCGPIQTTESNHEDEFCPVCHDSMKDELCMLPCGHMLCYPCSLMFTEKEGRSKAEKLMKCPTCRSLSTVAEMGIVVKQPDAQSVQGESLCSSWPGEGQIKVKGSYGTKIESVIRRISSILCQDTEARILLFSSWKDAIDITAHALASNGIGYLYPKTSKMFDSMVSSFREGIDKDNDGRVLLLLLKQGGNGLNLQQAQHVIFLEPTLDPGMEAQAIGRVDRMGQKRCTFVHKFIISATIEENVLRINESKRQTENIKSKHGQHNNLSLGEVAALLH